MGEWERGREGEGDENHSTRHKRMRLRNKVIKFTTFIFIRITV